MIRRGIFSALSVPALTAGATKGHGLVSQENS